MKSKIFLFLLLLSVLGSCSLDNGRDKERPDYNQLYDPGLLKSVLWHQTAGEYRALVHQAYNIARLRLEQDLETTHTRTPAIIADIDETVLDNSVYNATSIIRRMQYPEDFYRWIEMSRAEPLPGALDFLNYASANGYEIFYITNRRLRGKDGTIENLKKFGFPNADEEHVFFKDNVSSKQPRRDHVAEEHDVVLILGDNLIDFSSIFEDKSIEARFSEVEKIKSEFGSRFIIFPNAIHGSWKKAVYDYKKGLIEKDLLQLELSRLRTF